MANNKIIRIIKSLTFFILDLICYFKRNYVVITLRGSVLDSDTMPLTWSFVNMAEDVRVCLVVDSVEQFKEYNDFFYKKIQGKVDIISKDSSAMLMYLCKSFLVIISSAGDLLDYRRLGKLKRRTFVRIYHGIITKSYSRLSPHSMEHQKNNLLGSVRDINVDGINVDIHSVESGIERFFRLAAEGGQPAFFKIYGYARYDRVKELKVDNTDLWLPEDSKSVLDKVGKKKCILYAPSHKDGIFTTTLFPVKGFKIERFVRFLKENNCALFLRMHVSEEEKGLYDTIVDQKVIFYAGQKFSTSPLEFLPFMDLLITDYSSIYMDFLPFDKPILFLKDNMEEFLSIRGIAFDYEKFFPGEKVDEYEMLEKQIKLCLGGEDRTSQNRQFVKDVLLPERDKTVLENLLADPKISNSFNKIKNTN